MIWPVYQQRKGMCRCMENRRSKMTKRLIKESLTELLETENLNSISVRMICERADLNRSTFYLHYETLDDLLSEFTEELMSYVWKNDTAFIREQDYRDKLDHIYSHRTEYLALLKTGLFHRYIMSQYETIDFSTHPIFRKYSREAFLLVSSYTVSGMEQLFLHILEQADNRFSIDELAGLIYRLNNDSMKEILALSK